MKFLIVGIDGGTQRIFEAFEMPFVHKMIQDGVAREMDEDLFSRGWAEIVNGETAEHTRAFYMGPKMDGTHGFSISYKTQESEAYGVEPIWNVAAKTGAKIGVMNVPTSSPGADVNGFMVGSGGGGVNKVEGLPEGLVYPKEVQDFLEAQDYIVDIRLTTSGINNIEDLFEKLILKERKRAKAYVELCRKYQIDFGFLVDRATTIVQYLCMSEIETFIASKSMPEFAAKTQGIDPEEKGVAALLKKFYKALDDNLRYVFESLQPEYCLLTADHSTVPYKYKGNMNAFLEEAGFLRRPPSGAVSIAQVLKKWIKSCVPYKYRAQVRKSVPQNFVSLADKIDWKHTTAFGHDYIDGIYINDERFNGPVKKEKIEQLLSEIIEEFESHPTAKEYGVGIKPYRSTFKSARFKDHLPDLILSKPDELHIVDSGPMLYMNPNYGPIPSIDTIRDDMFSGQKGRDPIFLMNRTLSKLVKADDPYNLTLAYKLTQRVFS